jgi:hypothetical protein
VCGLWFCSLLSLAACSADGVDGTSPSSVATVDETTAGVVSTATGQTEASSAGIYSNAPYWELGNLEAFDTLLSNADGYAYYYTLDDVPAGFEVVRVGVPVDMDMYHITYANPNHEQIDLYVFEYSDALMDDAPFWQEMAVDGVTYVYAQEFADDGQLLDAGFQWAEDGKIFLVHTPVPITAQVVQKYTQMKKVEFNVGQQAVGFGTGTPLIGDLGKIEDVIRGNSDIRYHTGIIAPGRENDLLQP